MATLSARSLSGLPEVRAGDDLAALIAAALDRAPQPLRDGEIVAIAHKVVSKAEGAVVALAEVEPSARERPRRGSPREQGKDPARGAGRARPVREVLRAERGVLICRTHHGFVCANAGVDASNAAERRHADRAARRPRRLGAAPARAPARADRRARRPC